MNSRDVYAVPYTRRGHCLRTRSSLKTSPCVVASPLTSSPALVASWHCFMHFHVLHLLRENADAFSFILIPVAVRQAQILTTNWEEGRRGKPPTFQPVLSPQPAAAHPEHPAALPCASAAVLVSSPGAFNAFQLLRMKDSWWLPHASSAFPATSLWSYAFVVPAAGRVRLWGRLSSPCAQTAVFSPPTVRNLPVGESPLLRGKQGVEIACFKA